MEMTKCGIYCATDCKAYKTECEGCVELKGKISWAVYYNKTHCPIFECATSKGFANCSQCKEAPCQIWMETRDPSFSDEAFAQDIARRLKNLSAWKQ